MTIRVYVEHHQRALTSASSYIKEITSSQSYRNAYNSLDVSASIAGSGSGWGVEFSASASAAYGEVNSLITSQSEFSHREAGQTITYNPDYLQISREVSTFVTIDGRTGKVFEKRYVDSTPTPWSREKLQEESVRYLRNKFHGEDSKIRGSTYTLQTCRNISVFDISESILRFLPPPYTVE